MPEGECRYISQMPSTTMLQYLCNILKAMLLCSACKDRDIVSNTLCRKTKLRSHGDDVENMSDIIIMLGFLSNSCVGTKA